MIPKLLSIFQNNSNSSPIDPEIQSFLESIKNVNISHQKNDLVSFDIISENDPDRLIVNKKLLEEEPFENSRESKAFGSFIGTSIGDSLGVFTEGLPIDYDRNNFKGYENAYEAAKDSFYLQRPGQFTDDTALALCIADSLILKNLKYDGIDLRYRFLLWFYQGYNNGKRAETDPTYQLSIGIGMATYNACTDFVKNCSETISSYGKKDDENGNGTIMRLAPIPIAFVNDLEKCLEYAAKQNYTTHNGTEAAECCRLLSFILWNFLNIEKVQDCKMFMEQLGNSFTSSCKAVQYLAESRQEDEESLKMANPKFCKTVEDRDWNWKKPNYKYSPLRVQKGGLVGIYCMDATTMALHTVYHTTSFKEAMLKAVNLGGDADSVGAVVGMIAGAMYGYNEDMKKWYLDYVAKWDENKCAIRAYKLYKLANTNQ